MPTVPAMPSSQSFVERWKNSSRRAHALLFVGPEGSGKRAAAEAVATDALGSVSPNSPDLIRLAPEKNAIKIESIRELIGRLALKPVQSEKRVVIIEEADSMTTGAANALLKTLEEPPPDALFLLLSSRPEELPATIRSRCQRVRFQIPAEMLRTNLQDLYASWEAELTPLWAATKTLFATASRLAEALKEESDRIYSLLDLLKALWHDLAVLSATGTSDGLLIPSARNKLEPLASRKTLDGIFEETDLILETERALDGNVNKTLALERLFYRLVS